MLQKFGKSWACLDLCISICKGKTFLDFDTNKCECLYLALEDSYHRLQDRLKKILKEDSIPDGFNLSIKCSPLDNGLIEELENYLKEHPNIKLIIIDTLQKIRGKQNINEGIYSHDYKEIGKLKEFADKHKVCVLAIHHLRKMKDSDVFNQISGSTGLTGVADTIIVMSKINDNNEDVLLSVTGRDVTSVEKTITFNKNTFQWNVLQNSINIESRRKKEIYNRNPIVITIKKMLEINPDGYITTANELLKTIIKVTKTTPKQNISQTLTREINNHLQYQLLQYDGIHYEPPNANGGSGGRKMFFSQPNVEEEI